MCKLFVSVEDLEEMSRTAERWGSNKRLQVRLARCVKEGAFSRLAAEVETGYLGQERDSSYFNVSYGEVGLRQ